MKVTIGQQTILIDKQDWSELQAIHWYADKYVHATVSGKTIYMHRLILRAPSNLQVDHANMNGLDNRRKNLRLATKQQNMANQPKRSDNTSGFKGVSHYKATGRWSAYIEVDQRKKHLGYFATAAEAARAYNEAATGYFGEFAQLNQMGGVSC